MNEKYAALRANVGMLGQLLGKSIKDHQGQAFLDKIETIRQLAKSSRKGNESDRERLLDTLRTLSDDELLPVARAFSQFSIWPTWRNSSTPSPVAVKSRSAPRTRWSRCSTS